MVTLTFSCVKEEISLTKLIGKWRWQSTCGGIVGCRIATETTNHFWIIDQSKIYFLDNEDTVSTSDYKIKGFSRKGISQIYELEFQNGSTLNATVENNIMEIDYGPPIVSIYKKIK
jgi:hypothetical protein